MNKPLFVPQYSQIPESAEGNTLVVSRGASPLKMNKNTLKPNITKIKDLLQIDNKYTLF